MSRVSGRDRDRIFEAIRLALEKKESRTERPTLEGIDYVARGRLGEDGAEAAFRRNFEQAHGRCIDSLGQLAKFFNEHGLLQGYCDPSLKEIVGEKLGDAFVVDYAFRREKLDDYAFAITPASGLIGESGTVVLKDSVGENRLAAIAPWVHVAVAVDCPRHESIAEAIAAFGDDPNVVFVTGPSKTADVEGILIEGVHGPGEQLCLMGL